MPDQESKSSSGKNTQYQNLSDHQIELIDQAISSVAEYGEVHLIVEKGNLRFLVTQKSFDVLKWRSGGLIQDLG
jgi:hypothetical protein